MAAGEEEEKAPAERTAQVSDADGHASEENEVLRGVSHSPQHEENEQRSSTQKEKSLQQKNEDENKVADKPAWEAEKPLNLEVRDIKMEQMHFSLWKTYFNCFHRSLKIYWRESHWEILLLSPEVSMMA